jgi:hypothetical protein
MNTMNKLFVGFGCLAFLAFAVSTATAGSALPEAKEQSATELQATAPRCQIGSGSTAKTCEPLPGGWYCSGFTRDTCDGTWIMSSGHCHFTSKPADCN